MAQEYYMKSKDVKTREEAEKLASKKLGHFEGPFYDEKLNSKYIVFWQETQEMIGAEYYQKLYKCLKKAIHEEDKLGCHVNDIVRKMAKCMESGYTHYDSLDDVWCDYFLGEKGDQNED